MITRNTKNDLLREIANILFINVQNIPYSGLLRGKLGIALFFYHYARVTGIESYKKFADEYIALLFENTGKNEAKDFSNGLAGIGWGMDYIVKNGFVEIDEGENILEDVDTVIGDLSIADFIEELQLEIPLFSKGLYFVQRETGVTGQIEETLNQCLEFLDNEKLPRLSLGYLDSMLFFVIRAFELNISRENCSTLMDKLSYHIDFAIEHGLYEYGDIEILSDLISKIPFFEKGLSVKNKISLIEPPQKFQPCNYMYYNHLDTVYNLDDVGNFIDESLTGLANQNITVCKELAGIGLELMKNK